MTEITPQPEPGSPEWLLATQTPAPVAKQGARSDSGWKIGTFVFGAATIVLAILLAGQLATPRYAYEATPIAPQPSTTVAPETGVEAPPITDVSQQVGSLGLVIMQNYSSETGWPTDVTLAGGTATTAEGIEIGQLPEGWTLSYSVADDGSGFTLTLEDENGETAVFGPATAAP